MRANLPDIQTTNASEVQSWLEALSGLDLQSARVSDCSRLRHLRRDALMAAARCVGCLGPKRPGRDISAGQHSHHA
jgi:hypothetical protein